MAEYTANDVQTVAVNQNVVFTDTVVDGCDLIYHRDGSGIVKLYPKKNSCFTRFLVMFSGNIAIATGGTSAATALSLAITIDGEPVPATTMTVTAGTVGFFNNVAGFAYVYVKRPCCSTIGIRNVGTVATDVQNANLIVKVA